MKTYSPDLDLVFSKNHFIIYIGHRWPIFVYIYYGQDRCESEHKLPQSRKIISKMVFTTINMVGYLPIPRLEIKENEYVLVAIELIEEKV